MKIHEYQGKEVFRRYDIPVPRGIPAFSVPEAVKAARQLGGPVWVVKAQIHAGGRGKGGGVKLARSIEDVEKLASGDPRHEPRHASDRTRGSEGATTAHRGRRGHRARSTTSGWSSTARRSA